MEWWLNHVGQMAQSVQDYSIAFDQEKALLLLEGIKAETTLELYVQGDL